MSFAADSGSSNLIDPISGIFPQGLIEHRPHEKGCHRPVQPDEKGDDGPDGAIDDGIAAHIIHIIGETDGIDHPEGSGKSRAGKDEFPRRGLIGGEIVDGGDQQDESRRHGQETGFCPDGDEFPRDGEELRHQAEDAFTNNHQNQHGRDEDENDKGKQNDPLRMTDGFFIAVDIGNCIGQVSHRTIGKPEGKNHAEGKDGAVAAFGHMGDGEV